MIGLIIRRLLQMVLLLFGISIIVFFSMHLAPGDPALIVAGQDASPETIENIREAMGLNDPLLVQYWNYLKGVLQGDLGYSYQTNQSVGEALMVRFPNTLKLAIASMIVATIIGVLVGIISAIRQNTWADFTGTIVALAGVSIPNFWLGTLLILIFAVSLQWFPVSGMNAPWFTIEGFKQLILPAITLGTSSAAMITRLTRSEMLEVINSDYIRTARSKGIKERKIIFIHSLRNAMIPVITLIGINFGVLLGGTIVTEQVFAINGIGRLMVDAISQRDFPMVQGGVLLIASLFVLVNLVVDILYILIDPRISYD